MFYSSLLTRLEQAGGQVGSHLARSLQGTGNHTVTAISRKDSKSPLPEGLPVIRVDYDDESSLVDALKGQQFLIISMSVFAPHDSQNKIIAAAGKAGVPYVMPNNYGGDVTNTKFMEEAQLTGALGGIKAIEEVGVSSWIAMCCSFWYEYSLAMGPNWYGFDFPNKKVTLFGDGTVRINTSTWDQCGRAIAQLLSLKELPEDENDTSPTVSQWKNKPLFISSFLLSQRDMLDSVHRVLGTTDADWTIEYEPLQARYDRGLELMKAGQVFGRAICMYTRSFFPSNDGNFGEKRGLANEVLQLPKEELDECTKKSIAMAESDWNPFTRVQ